MAVFEHRFRVMASQALVTVAGTATVDLAGLCARAQRRLEQVECRWTRFRPDSDLGRLARAGGRPVSVSDDTATLIRTMQQGAVETGGAYDPTMVFEIVQAGYGASITDPQALAVTIDAPSIGLSVHDVVLNQDERGFRARIPTGAALDPGGIGKGLAADIVAAELVAGGATGALVSIGGDIATAGSSPEVSGWPIVVSAPDGEGPPIAAFSVDGGGVATSSTTSRCWTHRRRRRHHVLDPRTRDQSRTDLGSVTVVAGTGWQAEVHATGALLAGRAEFATYLESRGLCGLAIAGDGTVIGTQNLAPAPAHGIGDLQ